MDVELPTFFNEAFQPKNADNNFLIDILKLLSFRQKTPPVKSPITIHHIVPVYWFKKHNLEVDNSKRNKVVLTVYEHAKLHLLMAKYFQSINDLQQAGSNTLAVQHICGAKSDIVAKLVEDDPSVENLIQELDAIRRRHLSISRKNYLASLTKEQKHAIVLKGIETAKLNQKLHPKSIEQLKEEQNRRTAGVKRYYATRSEEEYQAHCARSRAGIEKVKTEDPERFARWQTALHAGSRKALRQRMKQMKSDPKLLEEYRQKQRDIYNNMTDAQKAAHKDASRKGTLAAFAKMTNEQKKVLSAKFREIGKARKNCRYVYNEENHIVTSCSIEEAKQLVESGTGWKYGNPSRRWNKEKSHNKS